MDDVSWTMLFKDPLGGGRIPEKYIHAIELGNYIHNYEQYIKLLPSLVLRNINSSPRLGFSVTAFWMAFPTNPLPPVSL